MPNGWWILPSAMCGLVIWICLGWAVYEAVHSSSMNQATLTETVAKETSEPLALQGT
jgi:hypothetical protein